jgi:menaquinone-dependent protoporphyrinogen oxidase
MHSLYITFKTPSEASAFLDKMRTIVQPVDVGLFGGVMDASKLALILQPMAQVMDIAEEDFRDWDAIRAWAEGLRTTLIV